jgi:hypothetical protein
MKNRKLILTLLAAAVALSSCKKQLDQQPTGTFSEENAFTSFDHVQMGTNGAYGLFGAYARDMFVSTLLSDEAKLGPGNAGQGALTFRYQYSADPTTGGDVTPAYGAYYSVIDQVNRVLPNIYTVTATSQQEARRDIVKGQLLALRGIAHFELLQAYSKKFNASDPLGVPIMLAFDAAAKPVRNTMGEVMTQIEKDLADAKALCPAVTVANFTDTVMNKINIAAYQARIALYKGDYASAITYSSEVISSGVKPLVTGSDFAGIWTDANTNELLFRIRYATSTAIGSFFTTTGGDIYISPSDKLVSSFEAGDIRKNAFVGIAPAGNYVNKFYASSRGGRVVDMKVCRIAEMYLIRAEANAKKGSPDLVAAAADINTLRAQRISPAPVALTFASATDAVSTILNERFKELCFEGFRFFDLKRNDLPVQRNASDASPAWQTLATGNFRFVLPVPQYELLANPNMKQNAGY